MKYLFAVTMMLFSSFGFAETIQLPDATVNQEVLGGDILLIKMKDYVIISGKESQALENELGIAAKKQFTRDMVMTKSASELAALYNPSNNKSTVQTVINRYADVLVKIDSKSSLN